MSKRLVNQKHLMWVRTLPCFIRSAGFLTHSEAIQAHHLLKPNKGYKETNKRMGVKSNDSDVIPLCYYHHSLLHTKFGTEENFFKHYGMSPDAGQKYAKQLYEGNQNWIDEDQEDDLPF
jgi:hypothetical protein|tara:strand:+ start:289 stop:645 length:357 start_codon:yes stop_codon:yes gene_type:complete